MATKLYDLAVKTGEYTTRDGQTKSRYENIGSIMQKDDGGKLITMKRTFNPAGVPFREGSDSILLSMFEPRENGQQQSGGGGNSQQQPSQHQRAKSNGYATASQDDDDLPF